VHNPQWYRFVSQTNYILSNGKEQQINCGGDGRTQKPLYNKIDCLGFKSLSNLMGPTKEENKRPSSASVSSLNGVSLHAMYTMTFPL
jgi:hypothetical protein